MGICFPLLRYGMSTCPSILRATKLPCGGPVPPGQTRCHKHRVYGKGAAISKEKKKSPDAGSSPEPVDDLSSLPEPPMVPETAAVSERGDAFERLAAAQSSSGDDRDVSAYIDPGTGGTPDTTAPGEAGDASVAPEDDDDEGDVESTRALLEIAYYGVTNSMETGLPVMNGFSRRLQADPGVDRAMGLLAKKYARKVSKYTGPFVLLAVATGRCASAVYTENKHKAMLKATMESESVNVLNPDGQPQPDTLRDAMRAVHVHPE